MYRDKNPIGVQHNSLNVEVKKRKFADETLVEMPGFWTAFEVCVHIEEYVSVHRGRIVQVLNDFFTHKHARSRAHTHKHTNTLSQSWNNTHNVCNTHTNITLNVCTD